MKKIIFCFVLLFMGMKFIYAESFVEGKFINGEYVSKVKNGVTHYLTMQFIKDSQGRVVYCLEPYITFQEGDDYQEYEWDLSSYNKLSELQRRNIELIAYYGYGYEGRTSNKWYVITQVLIWKAVDVNENIYFTNKLNGSKISKYESEMEEILNDVRNHDNIPNISSNYSVNLGESISINRLDSSYELVSNPFESSFQNDLIIHNVTHDGIIEYKKKSNYYQDKIALYVSDSNQDLLRPGNINNPSYNVSIHVTKGDITLDIRDDHSYYTVESDLKDTCYEIYNDVGETIRKVCTSSEPLVYQKNELPYGEYTVKQISHGVGYVKDNHVYKVVVNQKNEHPSVILYNQLLKNTIVLTKYACYVDDCLFEKDAKFHVFDKNHKLVTTMMTDKNGVDSIVLGYGTYYFHQVQGLKDYSFVDDFQDKIVDETSKHEHILYNMLLEEPKENGEVLEEVLPPDTRVKIDVHMKVFNSVVKYFVIAMQKLKNFMVVI